jgi:hypothetical protein
MEPVERHFHKLSDRILPPRLWRGRSLHFYRRLDAGCHAVNRNLGTEDSRPGPRRYLTLKRESNECCRRTRPIAMGVYLIAGTAMNDAVWQRH